MAMADIISWRNAGRTLVDEYCWMWWSMEVNNMACGGVMRAVMIKTLEMDRSYLYGAISSAKMLRTVAQRSALRDDIDK